MSKNPQYTEVLSRVKAGEKIVDVGCCFGTDLRKLIVDGASPHNVFGIDLEQEFFDHGFALYRDETKFPNECCIAENMLEQQLSPGLKRLEGQIDIAYMSSFLHVFDIHEQLMAMRKVLKLLRKKPGSLIIGRQIGNVNAGSYKKRMVKYESASYYHNVSSFEAFMCVEHSILVSSLEQLLTMLRIGICWVQRRTRNGRSMQRSMRRTTHPESQRKISRRSIRGCTQTRGV